MFLRTFEMQDNYSRNSGINKTILAETGIFIARIHHSCFTEKEEYDRMMTGKTGVLPESGYND